MSNRAQGNLDENARRLSKETPRATPARVREAVVREALSTMWICAEGAQLRDEDHKKAKEIAGLLDELRRCVRPGRTHLLDAAAGHGYVGLLAARLLEPSRVTLVERDARIAARLAEVARKHVPDAIAVDVRTADLHGDAAWPEAPVDVVVALHACGRASDHVIDGAIAHDVRHLFVVPCCYSEHASFAAEARALAELDGGGRHGVLRQRLTASFIDVERTLRLEAAGYETQVVSFVAPTITPHHLLWRAKRVGEPVRSGRARDERARWLARAHDALSTRPTRTA